MQRKAYTVSIPSVALAKEADYAGIASGKDVDKFAETKLTPVRSDLVDAPYVQECPIVIECRLIHTLEIGLHTQFVGEIIDVKADEAVLNEKERIDILKVMPFIYDTGQMAYYAIGDRIGKAFSIGKRG
jgi:flavin reductase (DIM6/NTAB) family NADH-FMN oxidoreductase RutF